MISDYVKGRKQYDYPLKIQKGIQLHRAIDAFTDSHAATAALKEYFRPAYRLYAGAFADVAYDFFLANDPDQFENEQSLQAFTLDVYSKLADQAAYFPERFASMFPYMRRQDWLYNYQYPWGMEKSFGGLVRRSAYLTESAEAFRIFEKNTNNMKVIYDEFFPSVKSFATHKLDELLKH